MKTKISPVEMENNQYIQSLVGKVVNAIWFEPDDDTVVITFTDDSSIAIGVVVYCTPQLTITEKEN